MFRYFALRKPIYWSGWKKKKKASSEGETFFLLDNSGNFILDNLGNNIVVNT